MTNDELLKGYENLVREQAEIIKGYQSLFAEREPQAALEVAALIDSGELVKHIKGEEEEEDILKMPDEKRRALFAARLRTLRKALGVKQQVIADKLGITTQAYSVYEAGKREPNLKNLIALAKAFGVTTDYLLGVPAQH